MSCRGVSPYTKEPIETSSVERGSPWWPSDSEEGSGGEVVDGSTDRQLSRLDFGSGRDEVLWTSSWK
jgi:hypothetical protein